MSEKSYFNYNLFLILITPVYLLSYLPGADVIFFRRISLALFYFGDLMFIFFNVIKVRFYIKEYFLLFLLLLSIPIGIINQHKFSISFLLDILIPIFFLLKISIFRQFFKKNENRIFFEKKYLRLYIKYGFGVSIIVLIVLIYLYFFIGSFYWSISFNVIPMLIQSLITNSFSLTSITTLLLLLGGKRALLLAGFAVIIAGFLLKNFLSKLKIISLSCLLIVLALSFIDVNTVGISKYIWTIERFFSEDISQEAIDLLSGGRFGEINSILSTMSTLDFFTGKGAGFTYDLVIAGELFQEDRNNSHFTHLALVSKYGLVFYFFLYYYLLLIFFKSFRLKKRKYIHMFFVLYFISINIEFIFSYGIFINHLLPIFMGYVGGFSSQLNFFKKE